MHRLLVCWLTVVAPLVAVADEPVRKVLFLGIDGCRWDAVEAAKTPHLDRLVAEGYFAFGTDIIAPRETLGDTISGPGWSNLLCGVWPDKHGVVDNTFKGSRYDQFPHFFARVKQARPNAVTASFTDWGPLKEKVLSSADHAIDEPANGAAEYAAADAKVARSCAEYIQTQQPDVVMLYLGQVDETGHARGFHPKVPEYVAAIERVDGLIGDVLAAIRGRPTFAREDWLVLVGTDHGGQGTGHGGGRMIPEIRHTFLIVSGPSAIRGKTEEPTYQVDLVATALTHLGVPLDPTWQLDGRPVGLKPQAQRGALFEEQDGLIAVEAEQFARQTATEKRAWHVTSADVTPDVQPDGDPPHVAGASGGAYLELLPDTRRTHDDLLVRGENFSPEPGRMAILHYHIRVHTPGRYYVWVRAWSTGTEDNGLHIGLDGQWPDSGQRWQTVAKHGWHWDCKQRTAEVHTGVPMQLFLNIDRPGDHELLVSMREDGFEFDKLVLAHDREFRPEGLGPDVKVVEDR
jgi:hypothetical protein